MLALVVGGMYLGARALGLGVLATFLSRPILVGFFAGISLSILVGQIGRVTGLKIESDGLISPILELAGKVASVHWPSFLLAAFMFAVLQGVSMLRLPVPGPVVVVVLSVVLSAAFDFQGWGIAVVGDIPSVLPSLSLPLGSGLPLDRLLLGAAAVFLVSFAAGIVTARSFGARGGYPVDADREMVGFGAANIAAGLFGAFPVTASDSRTAINANVGGRSQLAAIVAAMSLLVVVLYLRPALGILPVPALGAILVAAALSLIDVEALRQLWRISRMEFVFALIALWGAASFGVLNGVVIAIAATFAYLLHQMMYPRDALLGRVAGRDGFYKLHRTAEARADPGHGHLPDPGQPAVLQRGPREGAADRDSRRPAGRNPLARSRRERDRPGGQHRGGDARGGPRRPRRQGHRAGPGRVARRRARPARSGGPDRGDRAADDFRGPRRRAARLRASDALIHGRKR